MTKRGGRTGDGTDSGEPDKEHAEFEVLIRNLCVSDSFFGTALGDPMSWGSLSRVVKETGWASVMDRTLRQGWEIVVDMMDLQAVALACAVECERQSVGLGGLVNLIAAYQSVARSVDRFAPWRNLTGADWETIILELGSQIDPKSNAAGYRHVPVDFAGGESGLPHAQVPEAMQRWAVALADNYLACTQDLELLDQLVKEFLSIHPFEDGNGRTAFLLYNLLAQTLDLPSELPDYFDERGDDEDEEE